MGLTQTIEATVTCVECGQTALAEVDLIMPHPFPYAPLTLRVGDSLTPHEVVSYQVAFVRLRKRRDPDRARVLSDWICPVCRTVRWAVVELGPINEQGSVVSVEARPMTRATIEDVDWIHASLFKACAREAGVPIPDHGELSLEELEALKSLVPNMVAAAAAT